MKALNMTIDNTERNDLTALCLSALDEHWKTAKEIVWRINGPRETTIQAGKIIATLKRLRSRKLIESRRGLQPTRNTACAGGFERTELFRLRNGAAS